MGDTPDPTDLFDTPGTYQIFYFVKDDVTGHTSPLMQGRVYRKVDGNLPPEPFDLLYPDDCPDPCAEWHRTTLAFDWEDALNQDPETNTITYTVLLSKDDPAFTDPIYIEGLSNSGCVLGPEHGIEDLSTYYWKVQAIDEYGAVRESTSTRVFKTDNDNPLGFGWIEGHVYSAYDDTPIVGRHGHDQQYRYYNGHRWLLPGYYQSLQLMQSTSVPPALRLVRYRVLVF